jgi:Protein of unknown function (DUF3088)
MSDKDILFLLTGDFAADGAAHWFCPDCAPVEGLLAYYPWLREHLDIRYVEFPRPRLAMTALVGEAHQGCPTLLTRTKPASLDVPLSNGWHVVADPWPIARYLRERHGIPRSRGDRHQPDSYGP